MALVTQFGTEANPNANSYITLDFFSQYLIGVNRGTENSFDTRTEVEKIAAVLAATRYIDIRWGGVLRGTRLNTYTAAKAQGVVTFVANPTANSTLAIGNRIYTFGNNVIIGADLETTLGSLVIAIDTDPLSQVTVAAGSASGAIVLTARYNGSSGNAISLVASEPTEITVSGERLTGGVDAGSQPLEFPRKELYGLDGQLVVGIPLRLQQATAEYAVRALAGTLYLADETTAVASGTGTVQEQSRKIGPIEQTTKFATGSGVTITRRSATDAAVYPLADQLMREYIIDTSRVIRA